MCQQVVALGRGLRQRLQSEKSPLNQPLDTSSFTGDDEL